MYWVCAGLLLIGAFRVTQSYSVNNHTYDEPAHLACGMQYLATGEYLYELQHPPLSRVFVALLPYLNGSRPHGEKLFEDEGRAILYSGDYTETLTLARLGVLPFFLLGGLFVFLIGRRLQSPLAGVIAVFVYSMLPIILAHAGVASTDMPFLGTFSALVYAYLCWWDSPTRWRGAFLGIAFGLCATSKFSSLPFFGMGSVLAVAPFFFLERQRLRVPERLRSLLVTFPVAFLVAWTVYGFQVGPVRGLPVPMQSAIWGMRYVAHHNAEGHVCYLLGESGIHGFTEFFPVAFLAKSPVPFTLALVAGLVAAVVFGLRQRRASLFTLPIFIVTVFLVSMGARINIGARHVLPVFVLGSVVVGVAASWVWQGRIWQKHLRAQRAGLVVLGVWLTAGSAWSHPRYLTYFNVVTAEDPGYYLVDSDLDWGQGLLDLKRELEAREVDKFHFAYFGTAFPERHGLPQFETLPPNHPVTGWVAVSETFLRRGYATYDENGWHLIPGAYDWLLEYEPETVAGGTIRLYHVSGPQAASPPP